MKILGALPVLSSGKRPMIALVIGFLFGGLGLGIYFRSFVDGIAPFIALIALLFLGYGAQLEPLGGLGGVLVAGVYGYLRAQNSNERLTAEEAQHLPPEGATAIAR